MQRVLLFLCVLTKIWKYLPILVEVPTINFHNNPSSGSQVVHIQTDITKIKENEEMEQCDVLDRKLVTDFSYALAMYHASIIIYEHLSHWSILLLFVLKILTMTDTANDIPCICEPANVLLCKPLLEHLAQNPYCQSQHRELDHNQVVFLSHNKHLPLQNYCYLYRTRWIFLFPLKLAAFTSFLVKIDHTQFLLYMTAFIQCVSRL